jgi:uncharacterized MAPEG superfamily protein
MVAGGFVSMARSKYGIPYPTMYAVPGTPRYYNDTMKPTDGKNVAETITEDEAYHFNLVQRAHQNTIENAPFFLALLLTAWPFPLYAGIAGLTYVVGRAVYMYGYTRDPKSRMWGAAFIYPALLTLLGLSITTMAHVAQGVAPY